MVNKIGRSGLWGWQSSEQVYKADCNNIKILQPVIVEDWNHMIYKAGRSGVGDNKKANSQPRASCFRIKSKEIQDLKKKIIFNYIFMLHGNTVPVAVE
jgi:hypothetical protein